MILLLLEAQRIEVGIHVPARAVSADELQRANGVGCRLLDICCARAALGAFCALALIIGGFAFDLKG